MKIVSTTGSPGFIHLVLKGNCISVALSGVTGNRPVTICGISSRIPVFLKVALGGIVISFGYFTVKLLADFNAKCVLLEGKVVVNTFRAFFCRRSLL